MITRIPNRQEIQMVTLKEGDKVKMKGSSRIYTISWVSKCGELISTENHGYFNPCGWSSIYSKVK